MDQRFTPIQGGCRCDRLRFEISAPPIITVACHCTGCQKMTASAYSLSAAIATEAFAVLHGEPVLGGLRGPARHFFCDYCKSWVFTRPEGFDSFVNVRTTLLDDAVSLPPFMETFTIEKLPWAGVSAVKSFERFPPVEDYGNLAAAYAEYRERTAGA